MLDTFGTTRTLSSPRLHAINNQQSTMTFAENKVYFTVADHHEVEADHDGGVTTGATTDQGHQHDSDGADWHHDDDDAFH